MINYECPYCHQPLKFEGKRPMNENYIDNDAGASFFSCGCVAKYDWGDALPSNTWRLKLDGTWGYWLEWEYEYPRKGPYFLARWVDHPQKLLVTQKWQGKKPEPIPKAVGFRFR